MAWYGKNTSSSVAKISPVSEYYYLTADRVTEGFTNFGNTGLSVCDTNIKTIPQSGDVVAVKAEVLKSIYNRRDFQVSISVGYDRECNVMNDIPLNNILTEGVLRAPKPEVLTLAFLTGGYPAIDLEDKLILLRVGKVVPKFSDSKLSTKLATAINGLIYTFTRTKTANCGGSFRIECPPAQGSDPQVFLQVDVSLGHEARDQLAKNCGTFTL